MNKQQIKTQIGDIAEQLKTERDEIHHMFIVTYCNDIDGNMIHDYANAVTIARTHNDTHVNRSVERYDEIEHMINVLERCTNEL